jgi:hypothetical protein
MIKRFDCSDGRDSYGDFIQESPNGEWVRYEDYARLERVLRLWVHDSEGKEWFDSKEPPQNWGARAQDAYAEAVRILASTQ